MVSDKGRFLDCINRKETEATEDTRGFLQNSAIKLCGGVGSFSLAGMQPLENLRMARDLHASLVKAEPVPGSPETGSRIAELLRSVEKPIGNDKYAKLLILRLTTDAHYRCGMTDSEGVRNSSEISSHYDELEQMLGRTAD